MATFQVPQFIEEKPKIVGPLTLQQFLYLAGAGGISFVSFYVFSFFLFLLIAIFSFTLGGALALGKVNGQIIPLMLRAALSFVWQPRRFTWQRKFQEKELDTSSVEKIEAAREHMGIQEKLKSIALTVTTSKMFTGRPEEEQTKKRERYQVVTYMTGERKVAKRIDYR